MRLFKEKYISEQKKYVGSIRIKLIFNSFPVLYKNRNHEKKY